MNKIMNFSEIEEQISKLRKELFENFSKMDFSPIFEFDLNYNHSDNISPIPTVDGVYMFEIKIDKSIYIDFDSWFKNFEEKWDADKYKNQYIAHSKKKRVDIHRNNELGEWMPIYIGKAKNLRNRFFEHLDRPLEKSSFSLKLKAHINEFKSDTFRFSVVELKSDNYNWVATEAESVFREKYNPILGK